MKKLTCVLIALALASCAAFEAAKPVIRTVDEAMAVILCKQAQAEKAGIDFADVKDAYCENREHFAPFLAQARAGLAAAQSAE